MATLPLSRSDGALGLTGDASLFKTTGCFSTLSEGRSTKRNGLSWEEVNCFRRAPLPSANINEKVPAYLQHIGGSRQKYMEMGLHTLPNEKGAFYNRPEFKNPMAATQEEWHARMSATKATLNWNNSPGGYCRRGAFSKPGRWHNSHPLSHLDAEEEQLSRIVRLMFPSTREMARVGSSLSQRSRRGTRPTSRPSRPESSAAEPSTGIRDFSAHIGFASRPPPVLASPSVTGDFNKTVSFVEASSSPTGGRHKLDPVQWDVKSPVAGLDPEQLRIKLKLLRRETELHWDPSTTGKHASRLVERSGHSERNFGNNFTVHEDSASGRQVYKAMKQASSAVQYLVQAIGDENRPVEASLGHAARPVPVPILGRPGGNSKNDDVVDHNTFSLREFRRRLLERYASILEAFNAVDVDSNRKLNLKEWKTVLHATGSASQSEARVLFDLLDADRDGNITLSEFHVGLESIAQVTDLESMRKRLLCLGCSSMLQALAVMDGGGEDTTMRPLGYNEFANALTRVWVVEPAEHRAIFEAVLSDSSQRHNDATVSIAELACALSAVSPCLLLEELRDKLLKRFPTLGKAWEALFAEGHKSTKSIEPEDFQRLATTRLGLTDAEAEKVFSLIDIDCSGWISRGEFLAAMALASPSLVIEEVRRKVRQRYLSIDLAFRGAYAHLEGEELNNDLELSLEEFADILEPLDFGRKHTRHLFHMMDGDQRGKLTLFEFFKGVRLVAPSCILEGMRLQLIQSYGGVTEAFSQVPAAERRAPLDRRCFFVLMQQLQVQCDDVDLIFDFLDVRNSGIVTINEITAALLNVQPGSWNKAAAMDRELRAEREVRSQLAPHHRAVNELKRRVKLGLREATSDHMPRINRRLDKEDSGKVQEGSFGATDASVRLPRVPQPQPLTRAQSLPAQINSESREEDREELASRGLERTASSEGGLRPTINQAKNTYHRIDRRFRGLNPEKGVTSKTVDSLRGYFKSAHSTLRDQAPLLNKSYSRTMVHRETQVLKRAAQAHAVHAMQAQTQMA